MRRILLTFMLMLIISGGCVNRQDYFYEQNVTEEDIDRTEASAESEIGQLASDVFGKWVLTQRDYPYEGGPDMIVHVPANSAYVVDPEPSSDSAVRVSWDTDQDVNCSIDKDSVSTIPSAGNKRYISVFAKYKRNLYDDQTDGFGNPIKYRQDDDFEIEVWAGVEAPSPVKLTSPGDEYVLLFDVLLEETTTAISEPVDWNNPLVNEIDITRVEFNKNVQEDELDDLVNTIKLKVASGEAVNAYEVVEAVNSVRTVIDNNTTLKIDDFTYNVDSTTCSYSHAVALSDNMIFVAYRQNAPGLGQCRVLTIDSNNNIQVSSIETFTSAATVRGVWCSALEEGKVLITYGVTSPVELRARIAVVNNNIISFGTEATSDSTFGGYFTESVSLSSTKSLVVYYNATGSGRARVISVFGASGTDITFGAYLDVGSVRFVDLEGCRNKLSKLSNNKVFYGYIKSNQNVYSRILNIDVSDVVTSTSEVLVDDSVDPWFHISGTSLSEEDVIIMYTNTNGIMRVRYLRVISDVINFIDYDQFSVIVTSKNPFIFRVSNSKAILVYEEFGIVTTRFVVIKDDNLIYGSTIIVTDSLTYPSIIPFDSKIIYFYISGVGIPVVKNCFYYKVVGNRIIGIATETKSSGEMLKIKHSGVVNGLSGLIPGDVYYCGADGKLKNNNYAADVPRVVSPLLLDESMRMGIALSDTKLLITR